MLSAKNGNIVTSATTDMASAFHGGPQASTGKRTVRSESNAQQCREALIGQRQIAWPVGWGERPALAIVSSRLGRSLAARKQWFAGLRLACRTARREGATLLTAAGTAADPYVRRAGKIFHLPIVSIRFPTLSKSGLPELPQECDPQRETWVSVMELSCQHTGLAESVETLPLRDRSMIALADRIVALSVRTGGNLEQALAIRLAHAPPGGSVRPPCAGA